MPGRPCLWIVRTGIPRQPLTVPAVFDGFGGAAADAGHAVGAVLPPHGTAVFQCDIGQWADAYAFAAGYARIGNSKFFRVYEKRVESTVDNAAAQLIEQRIRGRPISLAVMDELRGLINGLFGRRRIGFAAFSSGVLNRAI